MKVYSCLLISLSTGFPLLLYGYLHIVRVISKVHSFASSSNQQPTGWFDDLRKQLCFLFLSRFRYSLEGKKGSHLVSLLVGTHILACLQNDCLFRAFLIVLTQVDLLVEHKPSWVHIVDQIWLPLIMLCFFLGVYNPVINPNEKRQLTW